MDPFDSALDLAAAVGRRELSPVEIVDTYLDRIERLDPGVGAFVWRADDEVRRAARAAEQAVLDGEDLPPFHGVPIPIKDLTEVAGQPATYGSFGVDDTPRTRTEPVVQRFIDAGFLLMGRTNTPDMGLMSTTDNARYGSTRNPWSPAHTSGGSSGGAAAAVAAGLAPVGPRQRRRRVDPDAVVLLRAGRVEAEPRPGPPARRGVGTCRGRGRDHPDGPGRRRSAGRDERA
jgi:amidase